MLTTQSDQYNAVGEGRFSKDQDLTQDTDKRS